MNKERLDNLVNITSGYALKSDLFGEDTSLMPVVRIRDIDKGGTATFTSEKVQDEKFVVRTGAILVAMDGEFKVAIWEGKDAYLNQRVCKIEPKGKQLDKAYLYYFLPKELKKIEDATPFVTVKHLSVKDINNIQINLPSLETQQQIVAVLDKAQSIIDKRKASLQLLDQLLRDTFLDMFGDPVSNPKGWPVVKIGSFIDEIQSGWSALGEQREKGKDELGVLKVSAVTSGEFKSAEHKAIKKSEVKNKTLIIPKKGDLLFSRANTFDLVAATCIVDDDYDDLFLPDKLWKLLLNGLEVKNSYFKYVLSNSRYRESLAKTASGTSGSMLNLSMEKLREHRFPIAPMKDQQKFDELYNKRIRIRKEGNISLIQSETLFQSLLQKAFNGKLTEEIESEKKPVRGTMTGSTDDKELPPIKLIGPVISRHRELYSFLAERVKKYTTSTKVWKIAGVSIPQINRTMVRFEKRINELLTGLKKVKTRDQFTSLLEKNNFPSKDKVDSIEEVVKWFGEYETYHHVEGRWQIDVISNTSSNLYNCYHEFQGLLKNNSFLNFSTETQNFGKLILAELEEKKAGVDAEYDEELKKHLSEDPLSLFAKEKDFDESIIGEKALTILDVFNQNNLSNFSIGNLQDALIGELPLRGLDDKYENEITYEKVEKAINRMLDKFMLAEFLNQPFTFQQLQQALASINFTPDFKTLNNYIFSRLEEEKPVLQQAFFDEQMANVNATAYQYLLDTMDYKLMGQDVFTPPRRNYLIYTSPVIKLPDATAKA